MNDSKLTPPPGDEPMSLRECRLILERLLVVAGTDPGVLLATRDALVDAQVLGVPVLEELHAHPGLLDPGPVSFSRRPDHELRVEAAGQFSLLLLPWLTDALVDDVRREGTARVVVQGARYPENLEVLRPRLAAHGVEVAPALAPDGTELLGQPGSVSDVLTTATRRAGENGFRVRGTVWLDLYTRSNRALVPDSPATRRHAGHGDVDEHGNFVRQMDDDADLERALLSKSTGSR